MGCTEDKSIKTIEDLKPKIDGIEKENKIGNSKNNNIFY